MHGVPLSSGPALLCYKLRARVNVNAALRAPLLKSAALDTGAIPRYVRSDL